MRARVLSIAAVLTVAVTLAVLPPARAATVSAPVTTQVITVKASSWTTSYATLEAWSRTGSGSFRRVAGPWKARLGYNGLAEPGQKVEGDGQTPSGRYRISPGFGAAKDPGTSLPYFRVDSQDWWVSDTESPYYNQHYRCSPGACPFDESASEHLIAYPKQYRYAALIRYNYAPATPGLGSAIFLHASGSGATAGCVSVSASRMAWLLRWMKPATSTRHNPLISIDVGSRAYAPIPSRVT